MKTIALRKLLREPVKVKQLTRAGQSVQVTDDGKPLWVIHPADGEANPEARARAIDGLLDEVLQLPLSKLNLAKTLDESRR
jgi:hypothetical protein